MVNDSVRGHIVLFGGYNLPGGALGDTWRYSTCRNSLDCDDHNPCTDDTCNAGACVHANNTAACSDGNACTTNDMCALGLCAGGAPRICDDGNSCTDDFCDLVSGCVHGPRQCDDGNACTAESCNAALGCVNTPVNLDATDFSSARIDGRDLVVVADAWNSCPDEARYDATANLDGVSTLPGACIDMTDFHLFMMAFGQSCP
jgi:hypothetical protein